MAILASLIGLVNGVSGYQSETISNQGYIYFVGITQTTLTADQTLTLFAYGHNGGVPFSTGYYWTFQDAITGGSTRNLGTINPPTSATAYNSLPNSTNLSSWTKVESQSTLPTITASAANGPDGSTNTASSVAFPAQSGGYSDIEYRSTSGATYPNVPSAFTFWARTATGTCSLTLLGSTWPAFSGETPCIATILVTTTWQRFTLTEFVGPNSFCPIIRYSGSIASTIYVWGFQQEINVSTYPPIPGPYTPTTGSPASGQGLRDSLIVSSGGVGTHAFTAYLNKAGTSQIVSNTVKYTVTAASPTLLITPPASAVAGNPSTVTVTLSPCYLPTGTITLSLDGTVVGSVAAPGVSTNAVATTTITLMNTSSGSHTLSAAYAGDGNNNSATGTQTYTVAETTPTLAVSASSTSVEVGTTVTYTATLTGGYSPTGSVTFKNNGTTFAVATINTGGIATATLAMTGAPATYAISAAYAGDSSNQAATATVIDVRTTQQTPTLTIAATNPNPALAGESFVLSASLSGAYQNLATGTLSFTANGTTLGTATLSGNSASVTAVLSVGNYAISVSYSGDAYNAATTATSTINVSKQTVSTSLTISPNPSTVGQLATLTATISGGDNPTGSVVFYNGSTALGTVVLISGQAVFTTSSLPPGTLSLSASYSGDNEDLPANFSAVSEVVNRVTPTLSLTNPSTAGVGQPITILATIVNGYNPTGTITFSGPDVGTEVINVVSGQASFTSSDTNVGTETVTVTYSGDTNNNTVTKTTTFIVSEATPVLIFQANLTTTTAGDSITLVALPTGSYAPTGTMTFLEDGIVIGTETVSNGVAFLDTEPLTSGNHVFTANYSGDAHNAAAMGTIAVQVNIATPNVVLSLSDTAFTAGDSTTITATIEGGYQASGSVSFYLDATLIGSTSLSLQTASLATPLLTSGTHTIYASYSGDQENTQANSPTLTITVELAPSIIIDAYYPNRVELRLGSFLGPLTGGATGTFNPSTDLEVFVDGQALTVLSFVFDPAGNRYLLFAPNTISTSSFVQVTHHMPSPPYHDASGVIFPGFTRKDLISDAIDPEVSALLNLGQLGTVGGGWGYCPFGAVGLYINGVFQGIEGTTSGVSTGALLTLEQLGTIGGGWGICPFGAIGLYINGVFQGVEVSDSTSNTVTFESGVVLTLEQLGTVGGGWGICPLGAVGLYANGTFQGVQTLTALTLEQLGTIGGGWGICPFGAIGLYINGVFQGVQTT